MDFELYFIFVLPVVFFSLPLFAKSNLFSIYIQWYNLFKRLNAAKKLKEKMIKIVGSWETAHTHTHTHKIRAEMSKTFNKLY